MLRPRKKFTIFDLQQLKGQRCLTHIHVKSPEEAAAARLEIQRRLLRAAGGAREVVAALLARPLRAERGG
mgnify:CR=1 FL=1